jgi:ABC-2 type transport system ATP-binding protein
LTDAAHRPVEQYSRGMKQRLHIARGLVTKPEVLFMDEPTIGLDPVGAQDLRRLIPELIARGKTILLTTHYMSEADELCQQISIINRGQITAHGTPSEIKRKFSKIGILEVLCRQTGNDHEKRLSSIRGILRVISTMDGPFNRITLHMVPDAKVEADVKRLLGENSIESLIQRDPTLEEAYLSIIN